MTPVAQMSEKVVYNSKTSSAMDILFQKLDEAIDDMEQGRVQTIDEAWEEIDAI